MDPFFLALGAVMVTALIAYFLYFRVFLPLSERGSDERSGTERPVQEAAGGVRSCPLCGAALSRAEHVKTHVFPGDSRRPMRIFGCPRCYPPNPRRARVCPVCRKIVPFEGYAVATLTERPGRKHVHVLGCTGCRPGS